jgi:hypothetical protein
MLAGGNPKKMNKRRAMAAVLLMRRKVVDGTICREWSKWVPSSYDIDSCLIGTSANGFLGKESGIKAGHKYITIHK